MTSVKYLNWNGVLVSEDDYERLRDDATLFGLAYVKTTGDGYGSRVDPKDVEPDRTDKRNARSE